MGTSSSELSYVPNGKKAGRPKKLVIDGKQECSSCHLWVPLENFYPAKHTANGRETRCNSCNTKRTRTYKTENTDAYLRCLWRAHKATSGQRRNTVRRRLMAAESEVTHELLMRRWREQDGKCAITGIPMTHIQGQGKGVYTNVTIDRIDNAIGYTESNVRLVCKAANWMKSVMSDEEMMVWASRILNGPLVKNPIQSGL